MALMAASQTTLRPGPSWDETIVPALRKRLESESRTLSKRISAISVTSGDEAPTPGNSSSTMDPPTRNRAASPSYSPQTSKATAIPRPSFQQPRASSEFRPEVNGSSRANGLPPPKPRSRTYSQPKSFDPSSSRNGNGAQPINAHPNGSSMPLPTPESSRSTSPHYVGRAIETKPTRIPKVAGLRRTSSSSSRGNHQPSSINTVISESRHGHTTSYTPPTPESTLDLWRVDEATHSNQPRSPYAAGSLQHSRLLHEPPPFHSGSASSVDQSFDHSQDDTMMPQGRRSNESEERPFEHWYRGEVSRNGGVGELRVGKRMEMLEIANYGHTLRKASPRINSRPFPAPDDTPRSRKRADSVSRIEDGGSLYLDEERAEAVGRVLDEGPPTDLDPDDVSDHSTSIQLHYHHHHRTAPSSPVAVTHEPNRGVELRMNHAPPPANIQPSRIPAPVPTRQSSEPPRTRTPTLTQRGASEPPSFPSSSSTSPPTPAVPRSTSQPQIQSQTQKRRGKSPGAPMPASKRSRATAKSIADRKAAEKKNRQSIAQYPTPADGVDMVDAIPSWTEPVPASGNWDEVVLPVVARKKGLDGHYERAGGGPLPRKVNAIVEPEPAPGTFGYDHSKYRPPAGEAISMDEFGRNTHAIAEGDESQQRDEQRAARRTGSPPTSPVRLSPEMKSHSPNMKNGELHANTEEEAGCCKCIIM